MNHIASAKSTAAFDMVLCVCRIGYGSWSRCSYTCIVPVNDHLHFGLLRSRQYCQLFGTQTVEEFLNTPRGYYHRRGMSRSKRVLVSMRHLNSRYVVMVSKVATVKSSKQLEIRI